MGNFFSKFYLLENPWFGSRNRKQSRPHFIFRKSFYSSLVKKKESYLSPCSDEKPYTVLKVNCDLASIATSSSVAKSGFSRREQANTQQKKSRQAIKKCLQNINYFFFLNTKQKISLLPKQKVSVGCRQCKLSSLQ